MNPTSTLRKTIVPLVVLCLAGTADAQETIHYWDFDSLTDLAGGLATTEVGGTVDRSVHATYGEAYPGAGASLNSNLGGTGAGFGHLEADVHDGSAATALVFPSTMDFSFSYWSYDDTSDGDVRGPRIMDCLAGTSEGISLGSTATNVYNLRLDDDAGGSWLSNTSTTFPSLVLPTNAWVHVAVNVDRTNNQIEIFFDGVSQGVDAYTFTGDFVPTQDLDIGVINGGTVVGQCQTCGLDDLAFYDGLLGAVDIVGLAAGTLTPNDFLPIPASVTWRNGGTNHDAYTVSGPPVLGASFDAVIDVTGLPHDYAQLFGYAGTLSLALGVNKTVLVDFTGAELLNLLAMPAAPTATYTLNVPALPSLVGYTVNTQAAVFTLSGPPVFWELTNAQDMVLGN